MPSSQKESPDSASFLRQRERNAFTLFALQIARFFDKMSARYDPFTPSQILQSVP